MAPGITPAPSMVQTGDQSWFIPLLARAVRPHHQQGMQRHGIFDWASHQACPTKAPDGVALNLKMPQTP